MENAPQEWTMKILLVAMLLMVAGAALAGSCQTYCGEFAGFRWCNTTCR
jgi:hypothetical protein